MKEMHESVKGSKKICVIMLDAVASRICLLCERSVCLCIVKCNYLLFCVYVFIQIEIHLVHNAECWRTRIIIIMILQKYNENVIVYIFPVFTMEINIRL